MKSETCKPFLMQQIAAISPQLVCSLGNWATQTLLERKVGITKVRGQVFPLEKFVLFPLLHPAAALHQGNLLQPLRETSRSLRRISMSTLLLDPSAGNTTAASPRPLQADTSSQQTQMDLFAS